MHALFPLPLDKIINNQNFTPTFIFRIAMKSHFGKGNMPFTNEYFSWLIIWYFNDFQNRKVHRNFLVFISSFIASDHPRAKVFHDQLLSQNICLNQGFLWFNFPSLLSNCYYAHSNPAFISTAENWQEWKSVIDSKFLESKN